MTSKRIYLDHHATTPTDPRVVEAMLPYFGEIFGNAASRNHGFGRDAANAVAVARRHVGDLLGASASDHEIVFTSGATESNNLALKGVARHFGGGHLITQRTEHPAVLDPCRRLEQEGFDVTYLPVDSDGRVNPDGVRRAIRSDTRLVSVMLVNNEVGTIQPIQAIGSIARENDVLFHTDAVQGVGRLAVKPSVHADLVSVSAHKIYGPKGVGALYVRRGVERLLRPELEGGGHERARRSGTLNVPGIVGFGEAARLMEEEGLDEAARTGSLRDRLWEALQRIGGVHLNGPLEGRHPGNLNVAFDGLEAEALLAILGQSLAVSAGAACSSLSQEPSHVLRAMGLNDDRAYSSVRFGLGRGTTQDDIEAAADLVRTEVHRQRQLA